MAAGKCPSCGDRVEHLEMHRLFVRLDGKDISNGVTLNCGACETVLGANFDPHVVKELIVAELGTAAPRLKLP